MSYDLCIWDPARHAPLPTTTDEALETMQRLSKVTDWLGSSFGQFGGMLIQRYNADPQGQKGKPKADVFWRGDPEKSGTACKLAVFRLPIAEEPNIQHIAYVVESAAALGLVVYDDENGMCFLPDGRVLPPNMQEVWEMDLAELMALKAGTEDPNNMKPDNRTWLQKMAWELFNAIGQGNKRS